MKRFLLIFFLMALGAVISFYSVSMILNFLAAFVSTTCGAWLVAIVGLLLLALQAYNESKK